MIIKAAHKAAFFLAKNLGFPHKLKNLVLFLNDITANNK